MSTIGEVLAPFAKPDDAPEGWAPDWSEVEAAIQVREDEMRDQLMLAGVQFGLYPFIVSEVMATVGLGTPPTEEERAMIRANFVNGMEELRRQFGQ